MAQQTINVGTAPNDGTGTPLRTAFQYTNSNFTELYTALGGGSGLPGATTQVIFNDGGTNLAGDAGLVYNKTTDALTIGGNVQAASATITGDLTVRTNKLKVDATGVAIGATSASYLFDVRGTDATNVLFAGVSKGIRFTQSASTSFITGVDNTGGVSYQPLSIGGSALDFSLSGSTAMTLNATGLGVGTSSHTVKLGVVDTVNTFAATFRGNIGTDIVAIGTTALGASINAFTAGFGAATNLVLQPNGGNVGIGVTPAGTGGCLQLKSGITFPATQVASSDANTLDDYEEGTFTPNITGTGVTGITYTTQSGVYTKIGRVVTFAINIAVSASTRAAAIFQIGNLPFSATGSVAYGGIISYSDSGFFATAASNKPNLLISSTDVVFYKSDGSAFNGTDIAANAFAIRIAGTYFTS